MRILVTIAVLSCTIIGAQAQIVTQTIRGRIVDQESKFPLIGVNVVLLENGKMKSGTTTDVNGKYRLENVPVGRQFVKISYVGYKERIMSNLIVTSAKEYILNVELEESYAKLSTVNIEAKKKGEVLNEMTTVSARAFSVEETDRYAGSRSDPARMAANFAGVQGQDDSRNDLVIRGNSPLGVLWRVEGIDIPNPNHFAITGSTGGPVSIFNNKTLASSDFFTGAFPSEYGNSVAGVFDLRLRNGNNEKHEMSGQFGLFGTELMAEGPISKEKGSNYLLNYRYSSIAIFQAIGVNLGTDALPKYQDGAFKFNFPTDKGGNFSLFGLGGNSSIDILNSEQEEPSVDLYAHNDRDQYFRAHMGTLGATYSKAYNEDTYWKTSVGLSKEMQRSNHELIYRHLDLDGKWVLYSLAPLNAYRYDQTKFTISSHLTKKVGDASTLKFGANIDRYHFNFIDSTDVGSWITRWDHIGGATLMQPYFHWKWRLTEDLTLNAGVRAMFFGLNNSFSGPEPRLGLKWQLNEKSSLSAGIGNHSQLQPTYVYFYQRDDGTGTGTYEQHNRDMDFTKSDHYVLGYDRAMGDNLRMKMEVYHQRLYNIPIELVASSFSMVNQGSGFARFYPNEVVNAGRAQNNGIELTLEKFFSNTYYFMLTTSIFNSKYWGSDGVERDTDYNGRYAFNFLFGKEWSVGDKGLLGLGTKATAMGGRRTGPVDLAASAAAREIVFEDVTYNSLTLSDYFRWDAKINYKINAKKFTHEIAFDLVNILGRQNILNLAYAPNPADPGANPVVENYQLGFLPVFYYRIDF